jgi:hypothetical protein
MRWQDCILATQPVDGRLEAMVATKNPFPGMNPFLERNWGPVHTKLISLIDDEIGRE